MQIKFKCVLLYILLFGVNIQLVLAQDQQNYTNNFADPAIDCFDEDGHEPLLYGDKSADEYTTEELIEYISGVYLHKGNNGREISLDIDKQGNYQFKLNGRDRETGQIDIVIGENYARELYIKFGEFSAIYYDLGLFFLNIFPLCDSEIDMKKVKAQSQ